MFKNEEGGVDIPETKPPRYRIVVSKREISVLVWLKLIFGI